jgi:hypothetical protein
LFLADIEADPTEARNLRRSVPALADEMDQASQQRLRKTTRH